MTNITPSIPPYEEPGSMRLLVVNGHDLVDPNDGTINISNQSLLQAHKTLKTILNSTDYDSVIVAFDRNDSDLREWKKRSQYKNMDQLESLINHMGAKVSYNDHLDIESFIGALVQKGYDDGYDAFIYSHNKLPSIMMKLPNVSYINDLNGKILDKAAFQAEYTLRPENARSLLSIIGMPRRGVIGAQRVSEKNATEWLSKYNTISTILNNASEIMRPRRAKAFHEETSRMQANHKKLSLKITPLDISFDNFLCSKATPGLAHIVSSLQPKKKTAGKVDLTWDAYLDKANSSLVLDDYTEIQGFASDCSLKHYIYIEPLFEGNKKLSGFAVSNGKDKRGFIPISDLLTAKEALEALSGALTDKKVDIHCMDAKSLHKLYMNEMQSRIVIKQDFEITAYILGWTRGRTKIADPLTFVAEDKLEGPFKSINEFMRSHFSTQKTENIQNDHLARYAASRSEQAERLIKIGRYEIESSPILSKHFFDVEMPMASVLGKMENDGVYVNPEHLKVLEKEFSKRFEVLKEHSHSLAGEPFNANSPTETAEILYDKLKIRKIGGKIGTSEEVLSELAKEHELPGVIMELRKLNSLQSTVTSGLLKHINSESGRIHGSFNQTIAKTGRLSSSDPALQGIPARSESGRKIREAFMADSGMAIIAGDYSQVELRIMAHMANESSMITAFQNGADIHRTTASEVFNVPFKDVTGIQRRDAKAINFGLIYGMSEFGLAKELGISTQEAKNYQQSYFVKYPGVKGYMDHLVDFARKNGFVETMTGRKILLPDINSSNYGKRMSAERLAINAPIQGSAADIIKKAMVKIDQALAADKDVKMVMQVHDELVFEVPKDRVEMLGKQIKTIMEHAVSLKVPLEVDLAYGENWESSHTLDAAMKEEPEKVAVSMPKRLSEMNTDERTQHLKSLKVTEFGMLI